MKILLAPSESKRSGGDSTFALETLFLDDVLHKTRAELLERYRALIKEGDLQRLGALFGLKKQSDIARFAHDPTTQPTMKAIVRYDGVAFDYLDYPTLSSDAQAYVDRHVILFSNLFGPLRADDLIPEYKLKQGASIDGLKPEKRYKEASQAALDSAFEGEEILDLRAGFYDKFYKPSQHYTTLKFLKNGKSVSHWAKAYRGMVTRACAEAQVESIEALLKLPIEGLEIVEIQERAKETEVVYAIAE